MEKFANDLGIFLALEYFGTIHSGRKEHTFTGHYCHQICENICIDGLIKFSTSPQTLQETHEKFSFLNKELSPNNNNNKLQIYDLNPHLFNFLIQVIVAPPCCLSKGKAPFGKVMKMFIIQKMTFPVKSHKWFQMIDKPRSFWEDLKCD